MARPESDKTQIHDYDLAWWPERGPRDHRADGRRIGGDVGPQLHRVQLALSRQDAARAADEDFYARDPFTLVGSAIRAA